MRHLTPLLLAMTCLGVRTGFGADPQHAGEFFSTASGYELLSPQRNPYTARRTEELYYLTQQLTERVREYSKSLPPAETWGGDNAEFRAKIDGVVRTVIPLAIAARDDFRSPIDAIARAAEQDCLEYLVSSTAFQAAMTDVSVRLLPLYVPSTDGAADAPLRMIAAVGPHLQKQIGNELKTRGIVVTPERLGDISLGIASVLRLEAERKIVQEVVILRVDPRIDQSSAMAAPDVVSKARSYLRAKVADIVDEPFSPARIDQWAQQLTGDVRSILAGGETPKVASGNSAQSRPDGSRLPGQSSKGVGPNGVRIAMKPTVVSNTTSGTAQPLVGMALNNRKGRKVTIPQGSHGNAHLLTGVECEIGGKAGAPAMFNLIFDWRGPNGSHVPLKNLRVIGQATAMPGPERVSIALNSLSYVFPSGRAISVPVSGYVVDAREGIEGMIGEFNWNASKIMPYAVVSGGMEGFANALKSNSTVVVAGTVGQTTYAQTGNQLQNALYAGVGDGAGIMADYVKRVLVDIKPTISVRNGQKVTMILTQPVSFDVPEEEWDALTNSDTFDNYVIAP